MKDGDIVCCSGLTYRDTFILETRTTILAQRRLFRPGAALDSPGLYCAKKRPASVGLPRRFPLYEHNVRLSSRISAAQRGPPRDEDAPGGRFPPHGHHTPDGVRSLTRRRFLHI